MHEEKPTTMGMIQKILFFNKINKNKRIYSKDSFVAITGDCSAMSGSLSFYLYLLTQEIMKEIANPKRYFDAHKVIWANMSDRQRLYHILKNNSHIEKNGNVYMKGITYG